MDDDLIPSAKINAVTFSFYSSADIESISVKRITQQSSFDGLGLPVANGLHDPLLGPTDDRDVCGTCNLNFIKCPGHFGYIKLTMPVYNPFLFKILVKILNGMCFECHKLRIPQNLCTFLKQEMKLLEQGNVGKVSVLEVIQQNFAPELWEDLIHKYISDDNSEKRTNNDAKSKNISSIQVLVRKRFLRGDFFAKSCPYCKKQNRKLATENNAKIFFTDNIRKSKTKEKDTGIASAHESYLTPMSVEEHLNLLWQHDKELLELMLSGIGTSTTEVFVLGSIPVPPPKFRPTNPVGGQLFEHEQSVIFSKVIQASDNIKKLLTISQSEEDGVTEKFDLNMYPGNSMIDKINYAWLNLQRSVNAIVDSDLDKLSMEKNRGVKQILEKKEGMLRMNMMGKRVNYAARSVISPDPFISANEIGIPYVFATKLTYPQYVTSNNFRALKEAVINGPNIYPGATHVIDEQGAKIVLSRSNKNQREAIAKQLLKPLTSVEGKYGKVAHKVVYRHLKNGDVLLLNRQPSLHRPSIQAHRARVLANEKTLRLHYSNCKAYNADFDGDEMNAHFPQNEIARSEAYNLVATNHHYTVPKDGSPLGGLIQDHMISGVKLSVRGRFFDKQHYYQLITSALSDNHKKLKILPPTILKPKPLWTGKQVITTIILNTIPSNKTPINLYGSAKVSPREWSISENEKYQIDAEKHMDESTVVFREAELLVGVLDKAHYGPTKYGLVHCIYEVYGGQVANDLLTRFARLFTYFLQYAGFTLGISDITCTPYADMKRKKILSRASKIDIAAAARGLDCQSKDVDKLTEEYEKAHYGDGGGLKDLDLCMKQCTDNINSSVTKMLMPHGLYKKFPENNLQLMVESGAKGSKVNCMQISCLLGQIELEGRRPPLMLSGRSLPSFKKYDFSPYAGGFVGGRFLTGIKPQEYFFHCMAGREGLIDTAVKTSRSGYLQRCLIKHLEGICINYDLTVRDHDKSVIQFYYGEDALDITKAQFLHDSQFKFYKDNMSSIVSKKTLKEIESAIDINKANKSWKKVEKIKKRKRNYTEKRVSPFLEYSKTHSKNITLTNFDSIDDFVGAKQKFYQSWFQVKDEIDYSEHEYKFRKIPDPVLTRYKPDRYLGSVSENFYAKVKDYVKKEEELAGVFDQLMYLKAMRALAQPGDAVGLLSAQSIGEPSTQMTLNTFHFAGRGEMNVTLGIPRLREILMVASANIKTPTMSVPLLNTDYAKNQAENLKLKLTKVILNQVMRDIKISEKIITAGNHQNNCRLITIRFRFLPQEIYEKSCYIKRKHIRKFMEKFLNRFADTLQKAAEQLDSNKLLKTDKFKEPKEVDETEENQGNNEEGDDDDDDEKVKKLRLEDANAFDNEASDSASSEDEGEIKEKLDDDDEGYSTADTKAIKREEIISYTYERSEFKWCEVVYKHPLRRRKVDVRSILEEEVKRTVIHKVEGIQRALLSQPKRNEDSQVLTTEGVNVRNMYNYDRILDLNNLLTNDIHAVANIYGIEAANKVIITEIQSVFAVYGITVNYRHLSLIADYMTFEGSYKPFNRMALETSPSPLQRMSFESTMESLRNAVIYGEKDSMISPSSKIIAGKLIEVGSGIFEAIPKTRKKVKMFNC